MKAYVVEATRGAKALKLRDIVLKPPMADEVSSRLDVFGVNRAEGYRRESRLEPITDPVTP